MFRNRLLRSVRDRRKSCSGQFIVWLSRASACLTGQGPTLSDYAGCFAGSPTQIDSTGDGLLYRNSSESMHAVPDRASTTLLVGEKLSGVGDNGWFSGDYSTLRSASAQPDPQSRATATNPFAAQNPYGSVGGNDISEKSLPPEPHFGGWHSITLNYPDGGRRCTWNRGKC